jgi:hypothetical protein
MALTMRPTGLGHGVYEDNVDYGIFCGDWCIGRIYETRTGPAGQPWFWALHAPSKPGSMRTPRSRGLIGAPAATRPVREATSSPAADLPLARVHPPISSTA